MLLCHLCATLRASRIPQSGLDLQVDGTKPTLHNLAALLSCILGRCTRNPAPSRSNADLNNHDLYVRGRCGLPGLHNCTNLLHMQHLMICCMWLQVQDLEQLRRELYQSLEANCGASSQMINYIRCGPVLHRRQRSFWSCNVCACCSQCGCHPPTKSMLGTVLFAQHADHLCSRMLAVVGQALTAGCLNATRWLLGNMHQVLCLSAHKATEARCTTRIFFGLSATCTPLHLRCTLADHTSPQTHGMLHCFSGTPLQEKMAGCVGRIKTHLISKGTL